jgi:hypothetical protein
LKYSNNKQPATSNKQTKLIRININNFNNFKT